MRSLPPRSRAALLTLVMSSALIACDRDAAPRAETAPAGAPTPAGTVDSALPLETLLARFRATLPDTPTVLAGGAASPDALSRALLEALGRRDTARVRSLVVSRAEFAWLYYPHSPNTRPPYVLEPELVWMTLAAASEKGAGRLLGRFGGTPLRLERVTCPDTGVAEGPNQVYRGCRVRFAPAEGGVREMQLFGALLRRDGRYKFLSYANDL